MTEKNPQAVFYQTNNISEGTIEENYRVICKQLGMTEAQIEDALDELRASQNDIQATRPDGREAEIRTVASTGAEKGVKEARYDLVPGPALELLARLYGRGAAKYAAHNWRLGYEWSKSYAAAMRHLHLFWEGEDLDDEMQLPHVTCAAFHLFALATYMTEHPEMDDRFSTITGSKETKNDNQDLIDKLKDLGEDDRLDDKQREKLSQVVAGLLWDQA